MQSDGDDSESESEYSADTEELVSEESEAEVSEFDDSDASEDSGGGSSFDDADESGVLRPCQSHFTADAFGNTQVKTGMNLSERQPSVCLTSTFSERDTDLFAQQPTKSVRKRMVAATIPTMMTMTDQRKRKLHQRGGLPMGRASVEAVVFILSLRPASPVLVNVRYMSNCLCVLLLNLSI